MSDKTIPLRLKTYVIVDTLDFLHGCVSHSIAIINAADDYLFLFAGAVILIQ